MRGFDMLGGMSIVVTVSKLKLRCLNFEFSRVRFDPAELVISQRRARTAGSFQGVGTRETNLGYGG